MTVATAFIVVFCFAAAAETLFALLYGLLFPWRRSELGRQMLAYSVIVAALMDLGVLSRFLPSVVPSPWIFVAGYGLFSLTLTWRLVILLRMYLATVRDRHNHTPRRTMLPTLGRIVHYRGKQGLLAMRAAIVTATVDSLDPRGVESGDVPALDSPTHLHLWVFTPGDRGGFPEYNVPAGGQAEPGIDPTIPPGSWCWPPRV